MRNTCVRVLALGDTHIGFDWPSKPRVVRRQRGPDFLRNFVEALEPARRGEVDLVVHGGDLFHRSKPPGWVIDQALAPLQEVASRGIPVFLVPGNHERSRIPRTLFSQLDGVHIFEKPGSVELTVGEMSVAVTGFPFVRSVGRRFRDVCAGLPKSGADIRLLCMHQSVEGARVGVRNFMFREGDDVISGRGLPEGFAAVISGHIHRSQILTRTPLGARLPMPVCYPGSVERTSFVERNERKGYLLLQFEPGGRGGGRLANSRFVPLPARPMRQLVIGVEGRSMDDVWREIRERLSELDPEAVVKIRFTDNLERTVGPPLEVEELRRVTPPTMSLTVR